MGNGLSAGSPNIQPLRLFVWNCAGAFARKVHVVERAMPDIAVLSEVAGDSVAMCRDATGGASIGTEVGRGLAVIGFNGWTIQPAGIAVPERLFLPAFATRGEVSVQIVGVCVKAATDYVTPTVRALRCLQEFVSSGPTIVAGDFNQTIFFDQRRSNARQFARVLEIMAAHNLRSSWHAAQSEEFGQESLATYYHHWQREKPWHIDYAFVSPQFQIRSARLNSFSQIVSSELSDHVPLEVDLELY